MKEKVAGVNDIVHSSLISSSLRYLSGLARILARFAISSQASSLFQNSSAWQCVANEYGGLYSATALNSLG